MRTIQAINEALKKAFRNSSGFTLLETAVALGIMSMGTGLIGTSVFQVLSIERYWKDDRVAARDLRHVGSWFAGDALFRAQCVTIGGITWTDGDGILHGSELTIAWTDSSDNDHTAIYGLSGDALIRNVDGTEQPLADGVVSVDFSLDDRILLLTMEVNAGRGATETKSLQTYLRVLEPC